MAENRLSAVLRGCIAAFLGYIPHVTWFILLAERMLCALSSQSALQSLEAQCWLPTEGYLYAKLRRAGASGTIQVLARMVPAKVANWLQPASKCWFYPYKYLAVAVANIIWSIFRAPTAPLIPCSRSCLLVLPAPGIPPVQQSEITPAPLMTEIIQPSPEMSGLFATREQHFTLLGGCGVPWSLI